MDCKAECGQLNLAHVTSNVWENLFESIRSG